VLCFEFELPTKRHTEGGEENKLLVLIAVPSSLMIQKIVCDISFASQRKLLET